jgi:hypothetical protein
MSAQPPMWRAPRREGEEIRVELVSWGGADKLNVRLWITKAGQTVPTKSGFTLPLDRALSFAEAVSAAVAEAEARGLLP